MLFIGLDSGTQSTKAVVLDLGTGEEARIEAGHVWLPERAPWLDDLRAEIASFPHGRHDDQVDSISQFLSWHFDMRSRGVQFARIGGV